MRCCRPLSFDLVFKNREMRKHILIRTLCPQRADAYHSVFFYPQRRASAYQCALFLLRNSLTYAPAEAKVKCGPRPRAGLSRPVPMARYGAAANLVIPIASMGHTGSALLPQDIPQQTSLAAEVLFPLLPPCHGAGLGLQKR